MKRLLKDMSVAQPRLALRSARTAVAKTITANGHGATGAVSALAVPATAAMPMPDAVIEQARARAEKLGYDEGYRRGTAQARADLEAEWQKLGRLATLLAEAQQQQATHAAELAAEFAYTVTCRVLGPQALVADSVRSAAETVLAQSQHTARVLRVHPQDAALLERLLTQHPGLTVRADPVVTLGGCILEHGDGTLDARLETQLDELKRAVLAWRLQEAG